MSTITTIQGSDVISTSRTDINTNFANLNSDKIETSYLDTDTSLSANSDTKIPTQKAVKTYVDTGGVANASETVKGLVEEATTTEVTAGTDTGATGAKLFVPPSKMNTQINALVAAGVPPISQYVVGTLNNSLVKSYFNTQLPFIIATGTVSGAATTDFPSWTRSSTDITVTKLYSQALFGGTANDSIYFTGGFYSDPSTTIKFNSTHTVILDWFGYLPATSTGDIFMGFFRYYPTGVEVLYDGNSNGNYNRIGFGVDGTDGKIYAVACYNGVGITTTDISTGITNARWNNFRIELDLSNEARFYINGVLKTTISGANIYNGAVDLSFGFGRSDTATFAVTAPTLSLEMNP